MSEEQKLRVLENKVLRKIFGAKIVEIRADWRKLHIAELYALYFSSNIIIYLEGDVHFCRTKILLKFEILYLRIYKFYSNKDMHA